MVLRPHELQALSEADHYPNFILQVKGVGLQGSLSWRRRECSSIRCRGGGVSQHFLGQGQDPLNGLAWAFCLLRRSAALLSEVQPVRRTPALPARTCLGLRGHPQVLSRLVATAKLASAAAIEMERNLTAFEDCLGTCERILKTPIPLSYTR